jgi:hypothetical protein
LASPLSNATGAPLGRIRLNKAHIALRALALPACVGVEVERSDFPLGGDPERLGLCAYLEAPRQFIVLFDDISLAYINGELVQVDGSEHWWFEDRGPQCTLLVFIDDATSRLMHLQFVQSESTFAYFNATQRYLEQHGKPVAFYTDKHAVFRVNKPSGLHGDGMTQFGRALKALSIEIICANSSQAKGRVERAHKTLQDRLVKELRLAGVSTMEDGNAFLPTFMADYNARFAKAPFNDKDLHRPMRSRDRLDEAFAWRAERTPPVRQHPLHDRTVRVRPSGHRPEGRGRGLPRRATRGSLQGPKHALSDLRQAKARH